MYLRMHCACIPWREMGALARVRTPPTHNGVRGRGVNPKGEGGGQGERQARSRARGGGGAQVGVSAEGESEEGGAVRLRLGGRVEHGAPLRVHRAVLNVEAPLPPLIDMADASEVGGRGRRAAKSLLEQLQGDVERVVLEDQLTERGGVRREHLLAHLGARRREWRREWRRWGEGMGEVGGRGVRASSVRGATGGGRGAWGVIMGRGSRLDERTSAMTAPVFQLG
jgi:hypothetical protein